MAHSHIALEGWLEHLYRGRPDQTATALLAHPSMTARHAFSMPPITSRDSVTVHLGNAVFFYLAAASRRSTTAISDQSKGTFLLEAACPPKGCTSSQSDINTPGGLFSSRHTLVLLEWTSPAGGDIYGRVGHRLREGWSARAALDRPLTKICLPAQFDPLL